MGDPQNTTQGKTPAEAQQAAAQAQQSVQQQAAAQVQQAPAEAQQAPPRQQQAPGDARRKPPVKRALQRAGLWLTEASIAGAPMIPLFIFVTSFIQHEGEFTYVLPFVLFYAFNKAGEFTMGAFGRPNNAYRLAQIGAWMVIVGAVISLFGQFSVIFYDIGATLIGCGTSVFKPMYHVLKEALKKEDDFPAGRPELAGFLIMTIFSSVILLTQGHIEEIIIACYVVLSIVSLVTLGSFDIDRDRAHERLFIYEEHDWRKIIPALLLLAIVFNVRLFKQTANATDIMIVFVLSTIILFAVVARQTYAKHQVFEYHDIFYGEVLIFVLLYYVFWYIGSGQIMPVLIVNVMQFAGQFLAQWLGKRILALPFVQKLRPSNILVVATLVVSLLCLPDNIWCAAVCTFLLGFLTSMGFARVGSIYREEGTMSITQMNMTSQKMINIGLIAGQAVLVGVLAIVSFVLLGNTEAAMSAYALRMPQGDLGQTFFVTKVVGLAIFWLQGACNLGYEKAKQGKIFSR